MWRQKKKHIILFLFHSTVLGYNKKNNVKKNSFSIIVKYYYMGCNFTGYEHSLRLNDHKEIINKNIAFNW